VVRPDGAESGAADDLLGQDVRVTVVAAQSESEVLAVPVSAIVSTQDGQTSVTVSENGGQHQVDVVVDIVAGGFAEVSAVTGQDLEAGDAVVVGAS
jgi:HlyD family secretion protein